jgi:hypothetical protein
LLIVDFVVAGILLGALGVVAGEAYRIVATRREPASRRSQRRPGDTRLVRAGWNRCCQAIGLLLTTSGAFLLLVTLVATLLGVSDSAGWLIVGVLGIGGILFDAIGGWSVMNRYRVGGFDPVIRGFAVAGDAAGFAQEFDELFDDRSVPGTNPVPVAAPQDDPSSAPAPEPVAANPELAPADIQAGQPSQSSSSLTAEVSASAEAAEDQPIGASSPDTNRSTVADVPIATADRQDAVPPESEASHQAMPGSGWPASPSADVGESEALPASQEPEPARAANGKPPRTAPDFAAPNFEFPLLDLDAELPAWNAPPKPARSEPVSSPAPASSEGPGGFSSSLLAGIDPTVEGEAPSGRFSSRLLNELTGNSGSSREARTDIVLEEFSLPIDEESDERDDGSRPS